MPRRLRRASKKKAKGSRKIGSRAQVWHGTAEKTVSGLRKNDLMKSLYSGKLVSKKKSRAAKKRYRELGLAQYRAPPFKKKK